MCFFITIAVPAGVVDSVRERSREAGSIQPTANPSAVAASGPGMAPLLVSFGGCSCGWYKRPGSSTIADKGAKAEARYHKLGWSQAKIDRALASMKRAPLPDDGLHPHIVELLSTIVQEHSAASVWVHWFSGKVENETYTIAGHQQCALSDLPRCAMELGTDIVLKISRNP